jgi:hypothetical protein
MDRFVHFKNVNIGAPIKTAVQTLFRPGSAFDNGAMKFHLRYPNWFLNCQLKNWCCLQVKAWEGVRDATKHADMCIQGPYLTPTQPGTEHIRAALSSP